MYRREIKKRIKRLSFLTEEGKMKLAGMKTLAILFGMTYVTLL